jgi:hypothetical protein
LINRSEPNVAHHGWVTFGKFFEMEKDFLTSSYKFMIFFSFFSFFFSLFFFSFSFVISVICYFGKSHNPFIYELCNGKPLLDHQEHAH